MGELETLYDRYGKQVAFYVVYIKEAHPEDGWVLEENRKQEIAVKDPASFDQRTEVASTCARRLGIRIPVLLDALDNQAASQYGGWPDRLYLIARDGRIAFQGRTGPSGFVPAELERAIREELRSPPREAGRK